MLADIVAGLGHRVAQMQGVTVLLGDAAHIYVRHDRAYHQQGDKQHRHAEIASTQTYITAFLAGSVHLHSETP